MKEINIKGDIISNDMKWIYDWLGYESTCPKDVCNAISEAAGDEIIFKINSGGGSIDAASEIYTEIRSYNGKTTSRILGIAASAASVIATACYCEMSPTALFMMHNVSTGGVSGDHNDMEHQAEILKTADKTIAAAYVAKTGKSEKEILDLMEQETWVDAVRALELGLIDKIMFDDINRMNDFSNMSNMLKGGLRNTIHQITIPENMIEKLMKNQQEINADIFCAEKKKLEARSRLLKLGGNKK